MASKLVGRRAVVVGAGIGGLAAARALVDHFEQVVVLERDMLPLDAGHRSGTPQSKHLHVLLAGGLRALNELFPRFEQDLVQAGAVPLRATTDLRMELPGFHPFPSIDLVLLRQEVASSGVTVRATLREHFLRETGHERGPAGAVRGLC